MIYFYGGAFNPMTRAHLEIISNIMEKMTNEDRFIIGITTHSYKEYQFSYKIRKDIITRNLLNIPIIGKRIKIVNQTERTWKFLNSLTKEPITIILGEDEYQDLNKGIWHYSKELLDTYKFIVIPRTNNISSTIAREIINSNINDPILLDYITPITLNYLKEL